MDERRMFISLDGETEREVEILLTFDSKEFGKSYVFFVDVLDDDDTVYVKSFNEQDKTMDEIESEEEWNMIEEVFGWYINDQEKIED